MPCACVMCEPCDTWTIQVKGLFPLTATARSRVIASGGALQGHRRGPVAACRPCWSIGGPTAPGDRTRRVLGARYSGHLGRRKRRQPAARPRILHTRRHDRDERARCRVMVRAACEGRLWPQQVHQTDLKACRRRAVVFMSKTSNIGNEMDVDVLSKRAIAVSRNFEVLTGVRPGPGCSESRSTSAPCKLKKNFKRLSRCMYVGR